MGRYIYLMVVVVFLNSYSISFGEPLKLEFEVSQKLTSLVRDAAVLLEGNGEKIFDEFLKPGSIWSHGETYITIFDMDGNCVVHTDLEQVGKNQLNLKDVNGKPIFRSILKKVSGSDKQGWTHYMWPKPQSIFPGWKSVYAKKVTAPSGKSYIVTCGLYNMRMERAFVVEVVNEAINLIRKEGKIAFNEFRTKSGEFYFYGTYVFVIDERGHDYVNAAFPNLEGRNVFDLIDEEGRYLIREFIQQVKTKGSGWVDYIWARPGEITPIKKSAFVKGLNLNGDLLIVGSGVYLE